MNGFIGMMIVSVSVICVSIGIGCVVKLCVIVNIVSGSRM